MTVRPSGIKQVPDCLAVEERKQYQIKQAEDLFPACLFVLNCLHITETTVVAVMERHVDSWPVYCIRGLCGWLVLGKRQSAHPFRRSCAVRPDGPLTPRQNYPRPSGYLGIRCLEGGNSVKRCNRNKNGD